MSIPARSTGSSPAWGIVLASLLGLILVSSAMAKPKENKGKGQGGPPSDRSEQSDRGKGHAEGRHEAKADDDDRRTSDGSSFDRSEERILRRWFSRPANVRALPPGLRKRSDLPPGLQMQLRENGSLPHGLQKRLQGLPDDLERQLPRLPDDIRRVVLGRDVLLVDDRTQRIADILRDVLPR